MCPLHDRLHVYPGDRAAGEALRVGAYNHCGVPAVVTQPPSTLLVEWRGNGSSRLLPKGGELEGFLRGWARRAALTMRWVHFGSLRYCEQVRAVAGAATLVGLHGQGLTNSVFLRPSGLLVELFHSAQAAHLRPPPGQDAHVELGHQPLAVAHGMHYVAAAVVHTNCSSRYQWTYSAACSTEVDVPALARALGEYSALLTPSDSVARVLAAGEQAGLVR